MEPGREANDLNGRALQGGTTAEQATRTGALFLGGGGAAGFAAAIILWLRPVPGWNAGLLFVETGLAIVAGVVLYLAAPKVSLGTMQVVTSAASIYIGAGQVAAGPGGISYGPMLLLWPILWAFTYLPLLEAARIAVVCGVVLAAVVGVQDGWTNPVLYWVFLGCTFIVTAATMTTLVRRAEHANQQLHQLNATLEQRVEEQVSEVGRLSRLRRFLSPQVADAVLEADEALEFHRREIAVVFIDLRGFTGFASAAAPEEVTAVLGEYHAVVGSLVDQHAATVGAFAGDGVMLYFNDPLPCDEPCAKAVAFALELGPPMAELSDRWTRRGLSIGHGVGIALGYATIGMMGFASRSEYTALGPVVNLASRLCDEAESGEILLDPRANAAVEDRIATEPAGERQLKGLAQPLLVHRVTAAISQSA